MLVGRQSNKLFPAYEYKDLPVQDGSGVLDSVLKELANLGISLASSAAKEVLVPLAATLGKEAKKKIEDVTGIKIGGANVLPGQRFDGGANVLPGQTFDGGAVVLPGDRPYTLEPTRRRTSKKK